MHWLFPKLNIFLYAVAIILLIKPNFVYTQETPLHFESYTTENGLAQNLVRKTVQTADGFIWLITAHGLSRFDGNRFNNYHYNKNKPNGLASDFLTDIVFDGKNRLWIASFGNGLMYYFPEKEKFKNFKTKTKKQKDINWILKIYIDKKKHIWLGTRTSVYRSKITITDLLKSNKSFKNNFEKIKGYNRPTKIHCIYQDKNNNIWIGSDKTLFLVDSMQHLKQKITYKKNEFEINDIIDYQNNTLLLATNQGAFLYNKINGKLVNFFKTFGAGKIIQKVKVDALAKDYNGNIWLATYGHGLITFNIKTKKFNQYLKKNNDEFSIRSNLVASIFIDPSNTIFAGLRGAGLNIAKIRSKSFKLFRHKTGQNSISSNIIWDMMAISDSQIWIATQNGLNLFNPTKNSFFNNFESKYNNTIFFRLFNNDSISFITSTNKFLALFYTDRNQFKLLNWKATKNTNNNYISGYYKQNDSTIFLAFYGKGLLEYKSDGNIRTKIKHTENLYIKYLLESSDTLLWLATTGEGLISYNLINQNIKKYTVENGLNSNNLNFLYKDDENTLWIAGSAGINKLNLKDKKFSIKETNQEILNYEIYSIEEDNNNNLWLGSNSGLLKYNKTSNNYYVFKSEQGLQNNEFNTSSSAKTPDGHMIFGGINGFNYFHPDSIEISKFVPKIAITEFSLFYKPYKINDKYNNHIILNKNIEYTDSIILKHNENVISILFTTLDYAQTKNILYAYRLKGFNENWIFTDAYHNYAAYTNLLPGNYIFQVKSTNSDRVWTQNTKNLYIIIKPAFWQKTWFKISNILFLILLIYIFIRLRIKWAIIRQKKLKKMVKEQTREIIEKNTELEEQTEELNALSKQLFHINKTLEIKVKKRTKKLKKALQQAKQAENLISSFLSNISHEIRTPLNAISGFSQLIVNTDLEEEHKSAYGKIIDQNIDALLEEIDNIMNIAKLHSGKYKVINSSFFLDELFDNLFNEYNKYILTQQKNIKLIQESKINIRIFSDKNIVKQIMRQLIDNAVKYTEKGFVKFGFTINKATSNNCNKLKTIYDKNKKADCYLILFVKDTGIGISKKQQNLVFDAFMKVESKEKLFRGTGLGLSIVKKLADILNARINIVSEPNKGTEIFIKIPLSKI